MPCFGFHSLERYTRNHAAPGNGPPSPGLPSPPIFPSLKYKLFQLIQTQTQTPKNLKAMELLKALINQGNDPTEARKILQEMRARVMDGEDPEEVLYEEGLEPDYVFDLLY